MDMLSLLYYGGIKQNDPTTSKPGVEKGQKINGKAKTIVLRNKDFLPFNAYEVS